MTFGCKRMIKSYFMQGVSEDGDMQKGGFQQLVLV